MKEVVRFILKGMIKSKYLSFAFFAMLVVMVSLFIFNSQQASETLKDFEGSFKSDATDLDFYIGNYLLKEYEIGLEEEEQLSLDSLLVHEKHLKNILAEIQVGNLDFVTEHKNYIKEYENFQQHSEIIVHSSNHFFKPLDKIQLLEKHDLPYLEEKKPWHTALFTKQLFQIFFSPVSAFIFLLLFIYKYIFDRENRTFDFLKLNSLSTTSIYYGYLVPFLFMILGYILLVALLSFFPVLLTGNLNTIHYPIEMEFPGEQQLIFVWKWLIYMPLSWGIFVSLFLVVLSGLLRIRLPIGLISTFCGLLVLLGYLIFTQFGFLILNPIHLLFFYEEDLLSSNLFHSYLLFMFAFVCLGFIVLYPLFKMKQLSFKFKYSSYFQQKKYLPRNKWKLMQFEQLKSKRKNKVFLNVVVLLIIVGGTLIYVNQQYLGLPGKYSTIIEESIEFNTLHLAENYSLLVTMETEQDIQLAKGEVVDGSEEILRSMKGDIAYINHEIALLKELRDDITTDHFIDKYQGEILQEELEHIKVRVKDSNLSEGLQDLASIEQHEILNKKNIEAWEMGWLLNTQFQNLANINEDDLADKSTKLNYDKNAKYDNSALFFLYKYFDWNMMWLILASFVILLWTSISEEYGPTVTKNFLLTKPLSLKAIYVSKWVYNLFITYSLLLGVFGITFLISILFGGIGEFQYPMLVYSLENYNDSLSFAFKENVYFYFENLFLMLVKCGLLTAAQLFFLNSLFSLLGRWFTNQYATIIMTLLLSFAGYSFGNYALDASWSYLNPFLYFDTWNIVDGWRSIMAHSSKVNFVQGMIVLILSGFLLFVTGLFSGRKRG